MKTVLLVFLYVRNISIYVKLIFYDSKRRSLMYVFLEYEKVWGEGSAVKNTACSSQGHGFNSQHQWADLTNIQLSITPVPGLWYPLLALMDTAYTWFQVL